MTISKLLLQGALGALIGMGALAASVPAASAAVVCNRAGDCWHTQSTYRYRPAWGLRIHDDNWRWRDHDRARYRWREPRGHERGYWRGGVWVTF